MINNVNIMAIFNFLLFLTPIVCLVRIHLLSFLLISMFLSLLPNLYQIIKQRYFIEKSKQIKLIHPISNIFILLIIIFISYQFCSLIVFDFNTFPLTLHFLVGLKKISREIFMILIGVGILYSISNNTKHNQYEDSLVYLSKGIIFAAIIFLIDHIFGHAIFQLLRPSLSADNDIGYNISQSHQGQVFCIVIVWPLIVNLLMLKRKTYAILLLVSVIIIGFSTFIAHNLNYNAILSLLLGFSVFFFFITYRKYLTLLSILLFLFLLLVVPLFFIFVDQDYLTNLPKFKDSISHRFCIWHYYSQKVFDSLFFGYGFNSSEKFGIIENISCHVIPPFRHLAQGLVANGHHPHNIGLQSILELGVFGLLIITIFGLLIILNTDNAYNFTIRKYTLAILNKQNLIRSSFLASFFAFFIFLIAAVSIWSTWVIATIFFVIIIGKILIFNSNNIK